MCPVSGAASLSPVTDLLTPRLFLHPIDTAEGERIVGRRAGAGDAWVEDYPFDGDVNTYELLAAALQA